MGSHFGSECQKSTTKFPFLRIPISSRKNLQTFFRLPILPDSHFPSTFRQLSQRSRATSLVSQPVTFVSQLSLFRVSLFQKHFVWKCVFLNSEVNLVYFFQCRKNKSPHRNRNPLFSDPATPIYPQMIEYQASGLSLGPLTSCVLLRRKRTKIWLWEQWLLLT